jgi:hypothetical protein
VFGRSGWFLEIAQHLSAGLVIAQNPKSRRDERTCLSSLQDFWKLCASIPALKGWAIFVRTLVFPSTGVKLSKNRQIWQKSGVLSENGQVVCQSTLSVCQSDRSECKSALVFCHSTEVDCGSTEVEWQSTKVVCQNTQAGWQSTLSV